MEATQTRTWCRSQPPPAEYGGPPLARPLIERLHRDDERPLSQVAWNERGSEADGDGIDAEGRCQYRGRASFLVNRLPRTVALVSALARLHAEQLKHRHRAPSSQSDVLGRELFKSLAEAHATIFGCKPFTRIKSGETIGGSIDWARSVIRHAADAIGKSPFPGAPAQDAQYLAQARTIAAPYIARFRGLAGLSDRRVSDLLGIGWRDWQRQVAPSAR